MDEIQLQKEYKKRTELLLKITASGYIVYTDAIALIVGKKFFDTRDIANLQSIDGFTGLKSREDGTEILFKKN